MLGRESGQMVVELCVVMPVMLMVAVVVIDMLVFMASCARFDHLAPQAVIAVAGSPAGTSFDPEAASGEVSLLLADAFEEGTVSVEPGYDGRVCAFFCKYTAKPWPLGAGDGGLLGLGLPVELSHSCVLALRPYVIGEV